MGIGISTCLLGQRVRSNRTMKYKLSCMAALGVASGCLASDWPEWRGPHRDGQFTGAAWLDQLNPDHLQKGWRVAGLANSPWKLRPKAKELAVTRLLADLQRRQ
jgi:hypothetical protein